jgi:hypothetical protein
MSGDYDNTNSGALFRNKEKDETHPTWADYRGTINVDGTEYWLSAWLKTSSKGEKFMSLSVKPKEPRAQPAGAPSERTNFDEDIPFR